MANQIDRARDHRGAGVAIRTPWSAPRSAPPATETRDGPSKATLTARRSASPKLLAYQVAARALPLVPGWLARPSARFAGLLLWALRPSTRRQVAATLGHVPSLARDPRRRGVAVRRAFGHLALNYLDLFIMPHRSVAQVRADLRVEGIELLEAAVAQGRGVLVLAAHYGDFDRAITVVASLGVPVWLPVERLEPPELFALCRALRSHHGVQAVPADSSEALRELFAALRRGEIVLLTADRDVRGTGVEVPFFGARARLPVGPLVLARRSGAVVLGAFSWRTRGRRSAGHFLPLDLRAHAEHDGTRLVADDATDGSMPGAEEMGSETGETGETSTAARPRERRTMARALLPIARLLEAQIAAHPEQWVAAFAPIWDDAPGVDGSQANPGGRVALEPVKLAELAELAEQGGGNRLSGPWRTDG
jgi:KDO2-lipid IV(A) lauroyltransferase